MVAPRREPQVEVPPLGVDFVDTDRGGTAMTSIPPYRYYPSSCLSTKVRGSDGHTATSDPAVDAKVDSRFLG
ncbi:hypothetical protein H5410_036096 [Solanum commersonii]|uniref:Uncharacterized protein n=1 Tax=Solanum commersonii TaxID=4109 RepID=A0A9J5Y5I0_SOLCO|nr:hypothetical protein H5410_036096 [Solanum commersonii]